MYSFEFLHMHIQQWNDDHQKSHWESHAINFFYSIQHLNLIKHTISIIKRKAMVLLRNFGIITKKKSNSLFNTMDKSIWPKDMGSRVACGV